MLLKKCADVNASAASISGGLTVLQAALWPSDDDDVESQIDNYDDGYEGPDVRKSRQSQDTILQVLFDAGADISVPSLPRSSMTTLVAAVKTRRPDLVRWCLLIRADVTILGFYIEDVGDAKLTYNTYFYIFYFSYYFNAFYP